MILYLKPASWDSIKNPVVAYRTRIVAYLTRTETLKKVTATKYLYVSFVSVLKTKKTQVKVNFFSLSAKPDNEVDFNILQYILLICTRLLYEHNAIIMGTPFHRFSLCWRIF